MKYLLKYYWPLFRHQVLLALSWSLGQAAWSCCPCTLHYKVYVTGQLLLLRAHMCDWLNPSSALRGRILLPFAGNSLLSGTRLPWRSQSAVATMLFNPVSHAALCDSLSHCSILINIWACDICLSNVDIWKLKFTTEQVYTTYNGNTF